MSSINIYLESGKKKVFAGGLDWPGWCRSGPDETAAQQALLEMAPRYAAVLRPAGLAFKLPAGAAELAVTERLAGSATTDFGAPAAIPEADKAPPDRGEIERQLAILEACWQAFDDAVQRAQGKTLRTGPRGGGRDVERMMEHVLGADQGYLTQIAVKHKRQDGLPAAAAMVEVRQAIRAALAAAADGRLPTERPRGGVVWPLRYYVRRSAWHVLDHAWEIEDRME